jgi:hypothetical protein
VDALGCERDGDRGHATLPRSFGFADEECDLPGTTTTETAGRAVSSGAVRQPPGESRTGLTCIAFGAIVALVESKARIRLPRACATMIVIRPTRTSGGDPRTFGLSWDTLLVCTRWVDGEVARLVT